MRIDDDIQEPCYGSCDVLLDTQPFQLVCRTGYTMQQDFKCHKLRFHRLPTTHILALD